MTDPYDLLNRAHELAPMPTSPDAPHQDWTAHYAAIATAALAGFRLAERTSPDLGYLIQIHISSSAAVILLSAENQADALAMISELLVDTGTSEEMLTILTNILDAHGINPADLYPWFEAADFISPLQLDPIDVKNQTKTVTQGDVNLIGS